MAQQQQVDRGGKQDVEDAQCPPVATAQERIPSTVALGGHPLHPMLITFPIAFFIGAFASDGAYWWTRDEFWAHMSFWLLVGGVAGGTAAAISGIADFLLVRGIREHVTSWSHFIMAIMAMSMGATNLMLRWWDAVGPLLPWGLFLSALNVGVLSVAGWLGGNLVFRHLIGTGTDV
jgi:uncharacterized membrane protein